VVNEVSYNPFQNSGIENKITAKLYVITIIYNKYLF